MLVEQAQDSLQEVDHNFALADYKIRDSKKQKYRMLATVAASKGEAALTEKEQSIAHGLATAAALIAKKDSRGEEAQMQALVASYEETSEEGDGDDLGIMSDVRANEILGSVQDHDGFTQSGKPLISPDGEIAAAYVKKFAALPLPKGGNAILDADARASLEDNSDSNPQ